VRVVGKRFASAAVLVAALFVATLAHGQNADARRRAAEQFEAGKRAFANGQYVTAAEHFQQAALISPHPATLINAAEAWERAGEPARAVELCDRITAMPYADARFADAAVTMGRRLAPKIATVDVTAPQGGLATIDGGPEMPIPHRFRLPPGKHEAMVTDTARRVRRIAVEVAAGESRTVEPPPTKEPEVAPQPVVTPEAPAAPGPPPSAPEKAAASSGSVLPWVFFGFAGAAAGVGGAFAVLTVASRDDYSAAPNHTTADAFYRNRLIANVGLFGAAAFAATGVVILLVTPSRRSSVALVPSRDAAVLVGRVSF
jgi:Tetratricopeptide repeat